MTVAPGNSILTAAKAAKRDEFYTQWVDIEREMNAYVDYDPDVFRGKTVLLPCDDPEWSNFTKFFALHFTTLGIKKLISTSYAANSKPAGVYFEPTLFESEDPQFDESKTMTHGKKFVLDSTDINGDGVINIDDLQWEYLEGGGDFRSDEVTALRDEADIVITNPPFSLFRDFVAWLMDGGVKFSLIGNQNAITYKEIFPLIRENELWLGKGFPRNIAHFHTPYTPHSKWIEQEGDDIVRVPGVQWFTNIEHGRRHEPMQLMTMAENLKFNKKLIKWLEGKTEYQSYDNFDAIEIPVTSAIPSDYDGIMCVPVTWLGKYNPEQFEILFSADDMEQTEEAGVEPLGEKRVEDYYAAGGTGGNSKGHRKLFLYHPKPWVPYKRIAIRHRKNAA